MSERTEKALGAEQLSKLEKPVAFPDLDRKAFDTLVAFIGQGRKRAAIGQGTTYEINEVHPNPLDPDTAKILRVTVRHDNEAATWGKITMGGTYELEISKDRNGKHSIVSFRGDDGKGRAERAANKGGQATELAWALLGRITNPPLFDDLEFTHDPPRWIAQKKNKKEADKEPERLQPSMRVELGGITPNSFQALAKIGRRGSRLDGRPVTVMEQYAPGIPAGFSRHITISAYVTGQTDRPPEDNEWTMGLGMDGGRVFLTGLSVAGKRISPPGNAASEKAFFERVYGLILSVIEIRISVISAVPVVRGKEVLDLRSGALNEAVEIPDVIHGKEGRTANIVSPTDQMELTLALSKGEIKLIRVGASDSFPGLRKMIVQPVGGTERIKYLWTARGDMYQENDWPPPGQKRGNIPIGNQTTQETEPEEQPNLHHTTGLARETQGPGRYSPTSAHRDPA